MVGMILSQLYYEQKTADLQQQKELLNTVSEELLRLRIKQNTFLSATKISAIDSLNNLAGELASYLFDLYTLMYEYGMPESLADDIQNSFNQYAASLSTIIEMRLEIGLDENSGARKKFRQAAHDLEEQFTNLGNESLQIMLLQMRRSEKDFIERKHARYVLAQAKWADKMENTIIEDQSREARNLLPLLKEYQREFDQLVYLYGQLGLSSNYGVLQDFQTYSDNLNSNIEKASKELEATVNQAVNNLKQGVLLLVIISTGIMFIIVLNSSVVLRKALKGFLGFFEASKTEKPPVKIEDLRFKEFYEVAEMAYQMVQARENAEENLRQTFQALEQANAELKKMAAIDGLTGIANRRTLDEALDREWHRCLRDKSPLAVILIDIDHFKLYNDNYGHQKGDEALGAVASKISKLIERATDIVARYGGEEFAAVLSNTSAEGALVVAQKMVKEVEAMAIPHEHSQTSDCVTISAGVFAMVPSETTDADKWFSFADEALYEIKRSGRGRAQLYNSA